jgi:hypothetical protein
MENYCTGWGQWSRLCTYNTHHTDQPCELKLVLSAACIGVGPDRRRFEGIAVYAGPKILVVRGLFFDVTTSYISFY